MRNEKEESQMILPPEDAALFFQLWIPLLDYVNRKYKVKPGLGTLNGPSSIETPDAIVIANYVWTHPAIIDKYLAYAELPEEHREIIESWKRFRRGTFILERNLKKGSVFISADDGEVYMVLGLYSSWEEMFRYLPLPARLTTTLIPFRDKIISDGLVKTSRGFFSRGTALDFQNAYINAKKNGTLRFSL